MALTIVLFRHQRKVWIVTLFTLMILNLAILGVSTTFVVLLYLIILDILQSFLKYVLT